MTGSVLIFGAHVTATQMVGYSIALGGCVSLSFRATLTQDSLMVFKTSPDMMIVYVAKVKAMLGR